MLLHLILHHSPLRCTCLQVQREGGGSGGPRASQQEGTLGVGSCVLLPLMGVLGGGEYGEIAPHGELRRRLGPGLQGQGGGGPAHDSGGCTRVTVSGLPFPFILGDSTILMSVL